MKIALVRNINNTFKAAFDSDYEYIKKLKQGEIYFFEVKRERNIGFHRKFFALIKMVYENQEHYINQNDLRDDLLIDAGHYTKIITYWGEERKKAVSLSFASMSQDQFDDMYRDVLDIIIKHFNFDKQEIIDNVAQYF